MQFVVMHNIVLTAVVIVSKQSVRAHGPLVYILMHIEIPDVQH